MRVALLHYAGNIDLLVEACSGTVVFKEIDDLSADVNALTAELETGGYVGLCIGWQGLRSIDIIDSIRSSAKLMELPVIGVFSRGWGEDVHSAFSAGIDDFTVINNVNSLKSRVLAMGDDSGYYPESSKQKVYVFDTDRRRRALFARFLRRMGLDIVFAERAEELFGNEDISLVVASAPSVTQDIADRVAQAKWTKWLMTGSAKEIIELPPGILLEDHVSFFNIDNDIAQIVFIANELLIGSDVSQKRSSARLQYGTPVMYSSTNSRKSSDDLGATQEHLAVETGARSPSVTQGEDAATYSAQQTFGYSYNLSSGGIFIRSFAPPPIGADLEIEFQAPTGRGRVIVSGTVVWRQNSLGTGAATPRGFGFQYHDQRQAVPDIAALNAGYNALHKRFRRSSDVI